MFGCCKLSVGLVPQILYYRTIWSSEQLNTLEIITAS